MEIKKFTKFELARMKRTAQNVDQYISKKNRVVAKMEELQSELDSLNKMIELTEAPTRLMTGGYGTEDIIKKVVIATDKLDKNGNVIKQTSYEFKYPETIIPLYTTIPHYSGEGCCENISCEPSCNEGTMDIPEGTL